MLKKLYDKTLKLAAHKSANFYLSIVSFIESSFFPIPPDVMIIPMSLAKREEYLKIFFIATLFSSLGGLFGYFIGSLFTDKAIMLMGFYGYEEQVLQLKNQLNSKNGAYSLWLGTLFLAGFTPLPFKIFTITSGIINFNIFAFFIICLISRGLRFFIVAYFSVKFGKPFVLFLEKKGGMWFSVVGILIIIIVLLVYLIFI
jgi:membrane protein YqaA with SNARE-associated domain